MKFVALGMIAAFVSSVAAQSDCPESKQINCADDVRAAYDPCKKAAEAGGSDTMADLACIKYWNKMKSDCWPCICMIAHEDHLDIKGC